MTNQWNFRRRVNGTRVSERVLNPSLLNIKNINLGSNYALRNEKKFSRTSDELNHYMAFYEEEANDDLRKNRYKDEEYIKMYLDEHPELKQIIETLTDSCIVYNKDNLFCELNLNKKIFNFTEEQEEQMFLLYSKHMKNLGYNKEQEAWSVFYDWIAIGKLHYEIIYKTISLKDYNKKMDSLKKKISLSESKIDKLTKELQSLNESKSKENLSETKQLMKAEIKNLKTSLNEVKTYEKRREFGKKIFKLDESRFSEYSESLETSIDDEEEETLKKYKIKENIFNQDEQIPVEVVAIKRLLSNAITRVDGINEDGSTIEMYKTMDLIGRYSYLPKECIIEIDWGKVSGNSRYSQKSYLDIIRRNYNLTKSLEESRVAWNIMVGQFRLKMVVPTGSKLGSKAKEAVRKLVNQYKERLTINSSNGEISVNGEKNYPFGRNIALPSRSGQTTQIDSVAYQGVDLSNMDVVEYFRNGIYRDSSIPKSRFDRENNLGNLVLFKSDGIPFDELFFYKKSRRLTVEFSKAIRLPIYYDAILNDPVLSLDDDFYNSLQITFFTDSYFELAKEQEVEQAKLSNYSSFERIQDSNREQVFSTKFLLVEKFKIVTEEEWELNEKYKSEESAKNPAESGGGLGGGGLSGGGLGGGGLGE